MKKKEIKGQAFTRTFNFKDIEQGDDNVIELSFSSDYPVKRSFGYEVLSHNEDSINLERLNADGSVLVNHDPDQVAGVVEQAWLSEDKRGRAKIRFGKSTFAQEIKQDVIDGIRRSVSMQYRIEDLEETGKRDGVTEYTVKRWTPFEVSLVSIPADFTVGVGRTEDIIQKVEEEEEPMTDVNKTEINIEEERRTAVDSARKSELKRIQEINAVAERFKAMKLKEGKNIKDLARGYINSDKTTADFRDAVLELIDEARTFKTGELGVSKRDAKRFSFTNAIKGIVTDKWQGSELERDVMTAERHRVGAAGYVIPDDVLRSDAILGIEQGSTEGYHVTNTTGSFLVSTDHLAGSFIELLRNRLKIRQLGATIMSGLVGDVTIPGQSAQGTSRWYTDADGEAAEVVNAEPDTLSPTYRQVTMKPHWIACEYQVSRQLLHQGTPDIENLIRIDLASIIAEGIDYAALYGGQTSLGVSGSPDGLLKLANTASQIITVENSSTGDGVALQWGDIIELETSIATNNADVETMAYLTNAVGRGRLKETLQVANSTYPIYLWNAAPEIRAGMMNGYPAHVSNVIVNNHTSYIVPAKDGDNDINTCLFFGNWRDLMIGEWGGIELMVDTARKFMQGGVYLMIRRMCDIQVRRIQSFAIADEWDA